MATLLLVLFTGLVTSYTDWKFRLIPNRILLAVLLAGLVAKGSQGLGVLGTSLIGLVICLTALVIPFALGGIGGGDVKLAAVYGFLLGGWLGVYGLLVGTVLGGVFALVQMANHALEDSHPFLQMSTRLANIPTRLAQSDRKPERHTIPYGIPLGLGALVVSLWSVI